LSPPSVRLRHPRASDAERSATRGFRPERPGHARRCRTGAHRPPCRAAVAFRHGFHGLRLRFAPASPWNDAGARGASAPPWNDEEPRPAPGSPSPSPLRGATGRVPAASQRPGVRWPFGVPPARRIRLRRTGRLPPTFVGARSGARGAPAFRFVIHGHAAQIAARVGDGEDASPPTLPRPPFVGHPVHVERIEATNPHERPRLPSGFASNARAILPRTRKRRRKELWNSDSKNHSAPTTAGRRRLESGRNSGSPTGCFAPTAATRVYFSSLRTCPLPISTVRSAATNTN